MSRNAPELADLETAAAATLAGLGARGLTLASVESLTGGMFASVVTSVPGSSKVYLGGLVTYASRLKHDLAGVDQTLIARAGVVNAATAEAMAEGGLSRTGADVAVACTGVAGPDPQDGVEPGTVFIAVATVELVTVEELAFTGDRQEVRRATVGSMLALVAGLD